MFRYVRFIGLTIITLLFYSTICLAQVPIPGICETIGQNPFDIEKCIPFLPAYTITPIYGLPASQDNGRFDFFVMGEGFKEFNPLDPTEPVAKQDRELLFRNAYRFTSELLSHEPFASYSDFINVHVVEFNSPNPALYGRYEHEIDYPAGPYDQPTEEVIVDNSSPTCDGSNTNCFLLGAPGDWATETTVPDLPIAYIDPTPPSPQFFGADYLSTTVIGTQATWILDVPEDGKYKLVVLYTDDLSKSNGGKL